ncbi:hypothetical protein [Agrobacterium tumefaciens]|nr:hypothetical protein [Agrobacterium tumefaciens]AYM05709.1 hypothetical protein At1D1460_14670 [Agrobacterium tumefaciens]NSZ32533.1 hypothetical protein [Agrobacterium tumefaciens]QLG22154.1 hypothetical protein EML4_07390 [Agrobacterium tumefaciens]
MGVEETGNAGFEPALSAVEPVKVLHENDTVWARFYRDGKNLGEICAEFNCGVYDLSPWLTAPLMRSAPAQSVAVKALQDHVLADFTHLTEHQSLSGPYLVKRIKERFASFALSAQVQDGAGWQRLDNAFSNFINGYGDPYEPKEAHEAETARNLKELYDAFQAYRATAPAKQEG